jgi:hypothetical protein
MAVSMGVFSYVFVSIYSFNGEYALLFLYIQFYTLFDTQPETRSA